MEGVDKPEILARRKDVRFGLKKFRHYLATAEIQTHG